MSLYKKLAIGSVMLAGVIFSVSAPLPAEAAGLTTAQIQAIEGLLTSFGADASVIAKVDAALRAGTVSSSSSSSESADLKINGSNGPVTLSDNDPITLTWTSAGASSCYITNVRPTSGASNQTISNLPASGTRVAYAALYANNNGVVAVQCDRATDTVTLVLRAAATNAARASISASPSSGVAPFTTTFTAVGSSGSSYTIDFGDGSSCSGASCNLRHTYTNAGTYRVVISSGDASASTAVTATVPNPVINSFAATPGTVASGGSATLSWTTSNTAQCGLSLVAGSAPGMSFTGNASATTGTLTGSASFELRCAPLSGATGEYAIKDVTVVVTGTTANASISASRSSGIAPLTTSFSVSGAAQSSYSLDFGDGTSCSGTSCNLQHTYTKAGTYRAVISSGDASASTVISVTAAPSASLSAAPTSGRAPFTTSVSGNTGSGCNGGNFVIAYGDGITENLPIPADSCVATFSRVHIYDYAGTYTVTLKSAASPSSVLASTQVVVSAGAPTCTLRVTPATVAYESMATVSWTTTNATSFTIGNNKPAVPAIGKVATPASGSIKQSMTSSLTYSGTAVGPGGVATCGASVTVQ